MEAVSDLEQLGCAGGFGAVVNVGIGVAGGMVTVPGNRVVGVADGLVVGLTVGFLVGFFVGFFVVTLDVEVGDVFADGFVDGVTDEAGVACTQAAIKNDAIVSPVKSRRGVVRISLMRRIVHTQSAYAGIRRAAGVNRLTCRIPPEGRITA
jgi:hypothetical protein